MYEKTIINWCNSTRRGTRRLWLTRSVISCNRTAWQHPNWSKLATSRWFLGRIILELQRNTSGWQITWYEQDPHESHKIPHLPFCRHLLMMTSATPSWVPSWRPSFPPHPSTRNKTSHFPKKKKHKACTYQKKISFSDPPLSWTSSDYLFKCFFADFSHHITHTFCKTNLS